jgi:hypothetical protein
MIILILTGAAVLATGIAAHRANDERIIERREIARLAREHGRRRPNRAWRWI